MDSDSLNSIVFYTDDLRYIRLQRLECKILFNFTDGQTLFWKYDSPKQAEDVYKSIMRKL